MWRLTGNVAAVDPKRTTVVAEPPNDAKQRGLAATARPQYRRELRRGKPQAYAFQHLLLAVTEADIFELNNRHRYLPANMCLMTKRCQIAMRITTLATIRHDNAAAVGSSSVWMLV